MRGSSSQSGWSKKPRKNIGYLILLSQDTKFEDRRLKKYKDDGQTK
jgi:hypothetical protein